MEASESRYGLVSRRALLKASAGIGVVLALPSCGNDDVQVFGGATTDPVAGGQAALAPPIATTTPLDPTSPADPSPTTDPAPTPEPSAPQLAEPTPAPEGAPPATPPPEPTAVPLAAIVGELVISFTYTQGAGGKNERPYVAVWLENEAGDLVETVALWYQQGRRGERWLDHLDRWWDRDQARITAGGNDETSVISTATRQAGTFAVAWDGMLAGAQAPPGRYFVCVETAREEGPYSLVRAALDLTGSLPETALADDGELSGITVRTSV